MRPHDPQAARRPAPRLGALLADSACAALTWNVFQTLALVTPSFWMRRLRARLAGLAEIEPTPRALSVDFWTPLPGPMHDPADDRVRADVLIESDVLVFGLLTLFEGDVAIGRSGERDPVLALIDGATRRAGIRACYVGVITSRDAHSPVAAALTKRYAEDRDALLRRLPGRTDGLRNLRGVGLATWADMLSILRDAAQAAMLDDFERYAAARTANWMERNDLAR